MLNLINTFKYKIKEFYYLFKLLKLIKEINAENEIFNRMYFKIPIEYGIKIKVYNYMLITLCARKLGDYNSDVHPIGSQCAKEMYEFLKGYKNGLIKAEMNMLDIEDMRNDFHSRTN